LSDEVPRLEEAIRLLRLLAAPEDEGDEAVETARLVDDAISLSALHPACKNISFELTRRRDVSPVIARPTVLTHQIVVALIRAAEAAGGGPDSTMPVVFTNDDRELVISVGGESVRARLLVAGRSDSA
jgi:hypothetical protein